MIRFALTQMRTSIGRLVAAAIAIMLGTGFIAATLLSTHVLSATAESTVIADLNGADVVAEGMTEGLAGAAAPDAGAVAGLDGVAGVDTRVRTSSAIENARGSRWTTVQSLPVHGAQPDLEAGTLPTAQDQIAVSGQIADALSLQVGDEVSWQVMSEDQTSTVQLDVVGITKARSVLFSDAPVWATESTVLHLRGLDEWAAASVGTLLIYADGSVDADTLASAVTDALGDSAYVSTAQEVADIAIRDLIGNANFFVVFGLGFAAVAVGVAAMVIANTFEVLVAQRTRSLALLRCAGATSGQVSGAVLFEAVVLGVVASLLGALLGVGLGQAAVWFLTRQDLGIALPSLADIDLSVLWIPVLVGALVTVGAAIGPARAATRVSPIAALRPLAVDPVRAGGWVRLVVGLLLFVPGVAALAGAPIIAWTLRMADGYDLIEQLLMLGIAGGILTVAGFLVLSPFFVPGVVRLLGGALAAILPAKAKASIRLATANAVRNPRRTAATTSALVIGVGLIVMFGTGAATASTTLERELDIQFPADAMVQATSFGGLTQSQVDAATQTEGVLASAPAWTSNVSSSIGGASVLVGDPDELGQVLSGTVTTTPGALSVSPMLAERIGADEVEVWAWGDDGVSVTHRLPVVEVPGLPVPALLHVDMLVSWIGDVPADALLLDVADDDAAAAITALETNVSDADAESPASVIAPIEMRQAFNAAITAMLGVLFGLVGVAVIIALVGIANTLSLSVIERRREHGVLQAVGVTQPQLRGMLAIEGVLIAVTGALIGVLIGVGSGLAGATIVLTAVASFAPAVNWWVLAGCFAVAIVAGVIASVLPSRSATRVPVVVALAAD